MNDHATTIKPYPPTLQFDIIEENNIVYAVSSPWFIQWTKSTKTDINTVIAAYTPTQIFI